MRSILPPRATVLVGCSAAVLTLYIQMKPAPARQEQEWKHPMYRSSTLDSLFEGENGSFASSGTCDHCHGYDPAGLASVDLEGNDVNVVDDWSSSMMANSARDPLWRAKVSHEVFINPQLQEEIESTCTKCHAPLGNYHAQSLGQTTYSIEEMLLDSVALDGVSCLACHQQLPQPEVAQHTGTLFFDDDPFAYGPYVGPLVTPMALYSGYTPEHGAHITDAKLCAGCHSLVTGTVDLDGNPTGDEFIEQATWHEWLNSSYATNDITCQSCHLPRLDKQGVILAAGYDTPPQEPYGLHLLAGGNSLMLSILRDNREELGIVADETAFDQTIASTLHNLQELSLGMTVEYAGRTADTTYVEVELHNITGHKLPSGYPARRMTLVVVATDADGNEVFRSGGFDPNQYVIGEDLPFEPHHQEILSEDDVQIYEMVMGDVNGDKTTVLERAFTHLKDNRLVPDGFTTTHPVYDTTAIVLGGVTDPDFNHDPLEGSGTDRVHYHIPTGGYTGPLDISVEVHYQSVPPHFLEEMFAVSTPEIEAFSAMFDAADKTPVLMRAASIEVDEYVGITQHESQDASILWSMDRPEWIIASGAGCQLEVYDQAGRKVVDLPLGQGQVRYVPALASGSYLVVLRPRTGRERVERVVIR